MAESPQLAWASAQCHDFVMDFLAAPQQHAQRRHSDKSTACKRHRHDCNRSTGACRSQGPGHRVAGGVVAGEEHERQVWQQRVVGQWLSALWVPQPQQERCDAACKSLGLQFAKERCGQMAAEATAGLQRDGLCHNSSGCACLRCVSAHPAWEMPHAGNIASRSLQNCPR